MSYNLGAKDLLLVCSFIWIIIRLVRFFITKKKFNYNFIFNELLYFSFVVYCSMVIGLTIFPLRFGNPIVNGVYFNLKPFSFYMYDHINIIGNFLLLFPLGIYITLVSNYKNISIKKIFFIGFLTSCSIETIQLLTNILKISGSTRITDINDIILNTLGFVIGYFIYSKLLYKFFNT